MSKYIASPNGDEIQALIELAGLQDYAVTSIEIRADHDDSPLVTASFYLPKKEGIGSKKAQFLEALQEVNERKKK